MFISGGENVQPEEIEKVALEHCDVSQFVVVPVADAEFGHRPVAFSEGVVNEQEIKTTLGRFLPPYKLPVRIFPWPAPDEKEGIKPGRESLARLAERLMGKLPH
jgi:O-succinylbenzoic acid--CoA ligase